MRQGSAPLAPVRRLCMGGVLGALVLCLAGCAEIEVGAETVKAINRSIDDANARSDAPITPAAGSRINPQLQPAPELFDDRGLAIWDGARTLQGVWVAHPRAETARRVRIIDMTSQRAVDGALFRRDEAVSGSSVLISSEAAGLLGMEPNRKTELRIIALKPGAEDIAAGSTQAPPVQTAQEEPAPAPEVEMAALDPTPSPGSETVAAAPEPELEELPDAPQNQPVEAAPEPDLSADPAPPVEQVAVAEVSPPPPPAPDLEPASAPSLTEVEADLEAEGVTPSEDTTFVWSRETDTAPEPVISASSGADDAEIAAVNPSQSAPNPVPNPASEPVTPDAEPAATGSLFVVAGTFGVKENADRLIARIKAAGYPASGRVSTRSDTTLTQVVAGPFPDAARQSAALTAIRAMGVPDAIATRR